MHLVCPSKDAWVFNDMCYATQADCERAREQRMKGEGATSKDTPRDVASAVACGEP